ncbi:MAG: TonB-dependent receptor [Bacteroidales bacterium]
MMKNIILSVCLIFIAPTIIMAQKGFVIKGKVIDKLTRETLPGVNVTILNLNKGVASDSLGKFQINNNKGGTYRLQASSIGYKTRISPEILVGAKDTYIEIELEEDAVSLDDIVVVSVGAFRKNTESPVSLKVIGFTEIERSAGANRDISRVLQSFAGVSSSPAGYRNDLIVRGGGPSDNRFYIDGIEVPNINHFSTQGASGGPVGLINADLIQEVNFYTGAFPTSKGNATSSILDFKLKEGSKTEHNFSAVLGSSDLGLSGDGHIGEKTTYLFSVRQSYLQLLFKFIGLPFLPNYIDGQAKVKHKINKNNEVTALFLMGIDDFKLNTDTLGQSDANKYMLSSLPVIKQFTYTIGGVYKHYAGKHTQTVVLSRNYLGNSNYKHLNNDESLERSLDLYSQEREHKLRIENSSQLGQFRVQAGLSFEQGLYNNDATGLYFVNQQVNTYSSKSDLVVYKWGAFVSSQFESRNGRFTSSLGLRTDAADFNNSMRNPLNQLSPRLSLSYQLLPSLYLNANSGIYYQLPAYTAMGYADAQGNYTNQSSLKYQRSIHYVLGLEHRPTSYARLTIEGFYKQQSQELLSLIDSIPLASKANDYGVVGTEPIASSAQGRAYGMELTARWFGYKDLNFIAAYTFVRSEFLNPRTNNYIASSWDNRHLFTLTGSYNLPKNWIVGFKYRLVGGAPYTPFDTDLSSRKDIWDAGGKAYLDYSQYNEQRLAAYHQLDLRIDKNFFFKRWILTAYVDLQNVTNSQFRMSDALLSTGLTDPNDASRYQMQTVVRQIGTIIPAIGVIAKF